MYPRQGAELEAEEVEVEVEVMRSRHRRVCLRPWGLSNCKLC